MPEGCKSGLYLPTVIYQGSLLSSLENKLNRIQSSEENIGVCLYDLSVGKDVLNLPQNITLASHRSNKDTCITMFKVYKDFKFN